MDQLTLQRILKKFDKEIFKQQKFLGLIMRVMNKKPEDQRFILGNACLIDGTIETQIEYTKKKMYRLLGAKNNLIRRYGDKR